MCHEDWRGPGDGAAAERADVTVAVADGTLPGHLYEPPGGSHRLGPCVVVPDIYGTVPFYRELAGRLGALGHPTVLPDIFFREGPLTETTRDAAFARRSRMDEGRGIADVSAVVDHVRERYGAERVGVVGFCLGGLFVMDLCAERDDLVAVSYYGFPEGIPAPVRVAAPRPIDRAAAVTGPLLALWGEDDPIGVDAMERFGRAMTEHQVDYEAVIYPGAGHGFLQGLVEERPDTAVAADAWTRTLDLLAAHLGG